MQLPMSMLVLLCVVVLSSLWLLCAGFLNNTRDCNDSCSNEVNCTISPYKSGFCGAEGFHRTNGTYGPDIAAGPVDLNVETVKDSEYQYIYLSWKPPRDGSYNYLTGFLIQVTVISLESNKPGLSSITCFRVLPAPNWQATHRSLHNRGGVVFFMNCLRYSVLTGLDIVISIHSLPLKKDSPKLAVTNLFFEPDGIYWNPGFDKWADEDDVMHLVIQNPLKEAKFYSISVKAVHQDAVVFTHNFSAMPDRTDKLVIVNTDGLPHFLIPGLNKNDNYSIVLEVLDSNMSSMTHIHRVVTKPFTLNFTSTALASSSQIGRELDNRLIIIVCTAVAAFIALLVCLIWKGVVRPSKLRNLVGNCAAKLSGTRRQGYISFTPIYCYENEHFVCAVENHVILLRRCLDSLTAHPHGHSEASLCCSDGSNQPWLDTKNKGHNIIIYLSPRLGEILTFGPVLPSHCCKLDTRCHQALQSLYQLCQKGQGLVPVLVTFDCFKQTELAALSQLKTLLSSTQPVDEGQPVMPLRLSSFNSSGFALENIEQVLARFQFPNELIPQTFDCFQGWRECSEVRAIERCLTVLGESATGSCKELSVDGHDGSASEHCDTSFYSHASSHRSETLSRSVPASSHHSETLSRSVPDHNGDYQDDSELGASQDGVTFLPDVPLMSNCNGYHSGSDLHVSNNRTDKMALTNMYNCSELSHDTAEASRKSTYTNEKVISHSLYHQSQKEPRSYRPGDDRSLPIKDGRPTFKLHSVVRYKPNNFGDNVDKTDAFSVNSVESDCLLKSNDLSGRSMGQYFKDVTDDLEWGNQRVVKGTGSFIPPSLNHSNFTSMESVCERINRVNEHSGWSELNLSK